MTTNGITVNGLKMNVAGKLTGLNETGNYFTDHDGRHYKRYDFIETTDIPRLDFRVAEADMLIASQQPVILTGTGLTEPANKWTLDYLVENVGGDKKTVFSSKTDKFMYFNDKRADEEFIPPTKQLEMTFPEFARKFRSWKPGDERLYYQQMLTDSVSVNLMNDFKNFHWSWLDHQQKEFGWGDLTSNLLLIGMPGNITPVHYDEQQNFFAQVHGYKRVLLFHPKYFRCLYPYPYHHPCDRQSQVDFEHPDFDRFPLLKHAKGMEAVVEPGDVLYIPMYWWHYIESTLDSELTTSINFWYMCTNLSLKDITFPLNWQQKTTMTRNVEKMLGEALGTPSEIGPFLNALVSGRYPTVQQEGVDFDNDV